MLRTPTRVTSRATGSVLGSFAFESLGSSDLLQSSARAWSFGPAIRWDIFNGGRVRNRIRVADAVTEQAYLQYEQTVLLALEEMESALTAYTQEIDRRAALERSVTAAEQSVELVTVLYRTGLTDFQNVLDSERSLFVQQDELAESEGRVVKNLIRLYKALGGGWRPPVPKGGPGPEAGKGEKKKAEDEGGAKKDEDKK